MSTYYSFHKQGTNEYFDLGSGSWYCYYEDLQDVLEYALTHHIGFDGFVQKLKDNKTFDGYYDDGEFLDNDNIKYFLKPLYKWASSAEQDSTHTLGVELISDYELYEIAVYYLCKDKGVKYVKRSYSKDDACDPIDKAEDAFRKEHSKTIWDETTRKWVERPDADGKDLVEYYLVKKGSIFWQDGNYQEEGVSFERALAEMKNGVPVWRKSNPDLIMKVQDGKFVSTYDKDGKSWWSERMAECLLAEDWCF